MKQMWDEAKMTFGYSIFALVFSKNSPIFEKPNIAIQMNVWSCKEYFELSHHDTKVCENFLKKLLKL